MHSDQPLIDDGNAESKVCPGGDPRYYREGIVAARFDTPAFKRFEGRSIAEIAAVRGEDPLSARFGLIHEEGNFTAREK
jgi:hypothetical protein